MKQAIICILLSATLLLLVNGLTYCVLDSYDSISMSIGYMAGSLLCMIVSRILGGR